MSLVLQIVRFGCVGAAASAVHLAVVAALVPPGLPPAWANPVAFLVAFQVSYYGHRGRTFRQPDGASAYRRLFLVALGGFALNEAAYVPLLELAPIDYRVVLAAILMVQAGISFLIARGWVFRRA